MAWLDWSGRMSLYEGTLYWDKTVANPLRFARLTANTRTRVLIAGGGITGNLCAHKLSSAGMEVMVAEKGRLGRGSSLANTGLLQYRSDKMLSEIMVDLGVEPAVRFYRMCLEAIDDITTLNDTLPGPTDYHLRDTIYFASSPEDEEPLWREYQCLADYCFPAAFLDGRELRQRYGIDRPAALHTWNDAEVNPYRFVQALIRANQALGVRYFEDTELDLDNIQSNQVLTRDGYQITFDFLILTTGYSRLYSLVRDKVIARRTYAFCSEPFQGELWKDRVMIWETRRPYLYLRSTMDGRIIAGGMDEDPVDRQAPIDIIRARAQDIARQVEGLFPHLDIKIAYAWDGLFCGTTDGLPFIGPDPNRPNLLYLLGYEGNGMCYSMAGASILKDYIEGRANPYQALVRADR